MPFKNLLQIRIRICSHRAELNHGLPLGKTTDDFSGMHSETCCKKVKEILPTALFTLSASRINPFKSVS